MLQSVTTEATNTGARYGACTVSGSGTDAGGPSPPAAAAAAAAGVFRLC